MNRFQQNSIAVYTCVAGDFDHVGSHRLISEDSGLKVDYLYYTDQPKAPSGWRQRPLPYRLNYDNRRLAKIPKLAPHLVPELCCYETTIWIDGDMEIIAEDFPFQARQFLTDRGIVLSPHFDGRRCAYGEALIRPPKYASEPLDEQMAAYLAEGFPYDYGLYEGGVIVRNMQNEKVEALGARWLLENMVYSYQDQVSLPYCLWKLEIEPDVLPKSFREFGWVRINAHKRET